MPGQFGFIIHPLEIDDVARKFGFTRHVPAPLIERALRAAPPIVASHITDIRSPFNSAEGWFVACPLTSRQMLSLPQDYVLRKIIAAGRRAQKLGAKVIGLGAFTSVVGDAGFTVARALDVGVTTGNAYTVAIALEGALAAARMMDHDPDRAEFAVLGATGSIGQACARILARQVRHLTLIGRSQPRLETLAERILQETGLVVQTSTDLDSALPRADVLITVSSAVEALVEPRHLKPGAVVCDVARPRDVSRQVAEVRDDVLVIEGGLVEVPGDVNFGFNFGCPPKTCMACMAETMILALEERYEDYALGRDLSVEQIDEISALAKKHGFRLAGLRSFERGLSEAEVEAVRQRARQAREGRTAAARPKSFAGNGRRRA